MQRLDVAISSARLMLPVCGLVRCIAMSRKTDLCALTNRYGRGEACVTLALSLRKSEDSSRGGLTLLGSAVNQDGRSSSLTAPHGPSQQQARPAYSPLNPAAQAAHYATVTCFSPMHQTVDQIGGGCTGDPSCPGRCTHTTRGDALH